MWAPRSVWLAALLAVPGLAHANPPTVTVAFGAPAPELAVVDAPNAPQQPSNELSSSANAPAAGSAEESGGDHPARTPENVPQPAASHHASGEEPERSCPASITVIRRRRGRRERIRMPLLDCDGRPREEALRALSIMARPRARDEAPTDEEMRAWRESGGDPALLAEDVRRLHPGLLERLQRIGEAFAPSPIQIVSGYRPQSSAHSRHHHARALDIDVPGVAREALRDLALGFPQTGVGYYPNSVFVHVDVREEGTYWVDLSGPGERPRYVRGAEPPEPSGPTDNPLAEEIEDALSAVRESVRVPTLAQPNVPEPSDVDGAPDLDRIRRETDEALRGLRAPNLR